MSVMPAPTTPAGASDSCPHCGATLAGDQRYCLTCGRPCSPVRLPFLDVLQAEHAAANSAPVAQLPLTAGSGQSLLASGAIVPPTVAYPAALEDPGAVNGWLRRNSGLLGLVAVLLVAGLIGLLVGHWVGGSGSQVVKVDFPSGFPTAAAPTAASSAPSAPAAAGASSAHKASGAHAAATSKEAESEAAEESELKEEEKKPATLAAPKKTTQGSLKKLESSTGKKHAEELNNLGSEPVETTGH